MSLIKRLIVIRCVLTDKYFRYYGNDNTDDIFKYMESDVKDYKSRAILYDIKGREIIN